jgi:peroxiredoxin
MQRKVVSLVAVVALVWVAPSRAQAPALEAPLTNAEIVKLTKAGLSPDLIVMKVKQAPSESLDVSTDALIALRQQNVSDVVIAAIFDRVLKRTTPAPPAKASPTPEPLAAGEPPAAPARRGPEPFPDLELLRAEGDSIRLSQLQSKVTLMIVWATWNPPSAKELPVIQKLYDVYRSRSFDVVSLSVDTDRTRVAPFLKKLHISLPVYFASPKDAAALTASGIPATIILGPERTVLDRTVGFYPDWESRWKQLVEKYTGP